jgi:hypothetical protein
MLFELQWLFCSEELPVYLDDSSPKYLEQREKILARLTMMRKVIKETKIVNKMTDVMIRIVLGWVNRWSSDPGNSYRSVAFGKSIETELTCFGSSSLQPWGCIETSVSATVPEDFEMVTNRTFTARSFWWANSLCKLSVVWPMSNQVSWLSMPYNWWMWIASWSPEVFQYNVQPTKFVLNVIGFESVFFTSWSK